MFLPIVTFLTALLFTTLIEAEEKTFYKKETDRFWTVIGGAETDTGQATCFGEATKKDGSIIQIHRSLVDGELWVLVYDTEWQIEGPDIGTLRWNLYGANNSGLISGFDFIFNVKNKNTIIIQQVKPTALTEPLWNTRYFTLVMPGNLPNFTASFETKGGTMLTAIADCIKQNEKTFKDFKPSLEKVPDAVKEQL